MTETPQDFTSKLRGRRRLYFFAATSWVALLAALFAGVHWHLHFQSAYFGFLWVLLAASALVSAIILESGDCPQCGQRFVNKANPLLWRGPSPLIFRVHCAQCGFALFSREHAL